MKLKLFPSLGAAFAALTLALTSGCAPLGGGPAKYETSPVVRGDIVQRVTASGTLSAVVSVDVGSQVSGKISALSVDFNFPVKKGRLVAEIDPTVYEASLRQAEGELASAQANVTLKRQNLERKKILAPQRAASQWDLDQATAEVAQADASVIIKQAAVDSARANLSYCKITAPVDGIVISRKVDLGQTVIAAMSTPVLFTIAQDITKMNICASVSEADIGQVKDGYPVDFTVDAFSDEVFHGQVTQVRKAPTTTLGGPELDGVSGARRRGHQHDARSPVSRTAIGALRVARDHELYSADESTAGGQCHSPAVDPGSAGGRGDQYRPIGQPGGVARRAGQGHFSTAH